MGAEPAARVSAIFHAALERPEGERTAFVREACGDDAALRDEVSLLLGIDARLPSLPAPAPVTDLVGQRIGQYRVSSKLGAGGMGVVYRAHDSVLGRDVALKMLPPQFASDGERRARLDREARLLASLNHPGIGAIYGLENHGDIRALVLELVEGETLAHALERRPLSISAGLAIARQIADALSAAHDKGIVHRDLKPGNVMLVGAGNDVTAKVLDFGLATLAPVTGLDPAHGAVPTVTSGGTGTGVIAGTPAYMSPEQARGGIVDRRTDVWAFGCILFEMLAGKPAFERETITDTLAAIVQGEPDWAALPPDTPEPVRRALRWCLEKDTDKRLHDMADVRPSLVDAQPESRSSQVKTERSRSRGPYLWLGIVVSAAVVAAVSWWLWTTSRPPILTTRDTIVLAAFENTTGDAAFDGTLEHAMATTLEQSPYLRILSRERVADTLRLMAKPGERVTRDLARQICERDNLKAFIAGAISPLGSDFVVVLEAVDRHGDVLAREQVQVTGRERVLLALGQAATRFRGQLGESLASILANDAPIERVTTASLEAYQAFARGSDQLRRAQNALAIASFKRAIELDPEFAAAHRSLGVVYTNTGQGRLGDQAVTRAFELKDRSSERERLSIAALYYGSVTGELELALESYAQLRQAYPSDSSPHTNASAIYRNLGMLQESEAAARESMRLRPASTTGVANLVQTLEKMNRFEDSRTESLRAIEAGQGSFQLRASLARVSFAQQDTALVQAQVAWAAGKPEERAMAGVEKDIALFSGRLKESEAIRARIVALARRANNNDVVVSTYRGSAFAAAAYGDCARARRDLAEPPGVSSDGLATGLARALCGDASGAEYAAAAIPKAVPRGTLENKLHAPTLRAAASLSDPALALRILEDARPFDRVALFRSEYLRGLAYQRLNRPADAAAEFQRIIDHRGESATSFLYPLAYLGLGRSLALQGKDAEARAAYEKLLAFWKEADSDVPAVVEARREYARLRK